MTKFVNVDGEVGLVREVGTNAVLNVDNKALSNYRRNRELNRQKAQQFENITQDIDNLKQDIMEIKDLLLKITRD